MGSDSLETDLSIEDSEFFESLKTVVPITFR